jgi:endo-1,4-beta-D-glucanase Y
MMKHAKLVWAFTAVVTVVYIAALLCIRAGSTTNIQHQHYQHWREHYVMYRNEHQAYVNTSNDRTAPVALSEGQGYGLYLTALAGAKGWAERQDYDDLLNYYLAHREATGDAHDKPTYLMQWRQHEADGAWVSQHNSATDGDLFIAFSLEKASKVWPKRSEYYTNLERKLTADILTYEYNDTTHTLTVGDWADEHSDYYNLMRTSDVIPTFFDAFHASFHDGRWLTVKNSMLDRMVDLSDSHTTGLIPDFAWVTASAAQPVKGNTVATKDDAAYSSNACRIPLMLASSDDTRANVVVRKLLDFFEGQGTITAGYSLDGTRLNDYESNSFTAPLVYAADINRQYGYTSLLMHRQELLTESLQTDNYYDATLTTMAVMGDNH